MSNWKILPPEEAQPEAQPVPQGAWKILPPEPQASRPESPRSAGFLDWAKRAFEKPGDAALGLAETAATIGTGAAGQVAGGLMGIGEGLNPFSPPGSAAERVRSVQEAIQYQPREAGRDLMGSVAESARSGWQEVTPSIRGPVEAGVEAFRKSPDWYAENAGPLAGALASAVPEATMALGTGGVGTGARRAAQTVQRAAPEGAIAHTGGVPVEQLRQLGPVAERGIQPPISSPVGPGAAADPVSVERVAEAARKGKPEPLAQMVDPDPEIVAAAGELDVRLPPSSKSRNQAYIEVEQALKAEPGSAISTLENKAINDLSARADELINDLGGHTDKAGLDASLRSEMMERIEQLNNHAGRAYDNVRRKVPASYPVEGNAARAYIQSVMEDVGGDVKRLSPGEKSLLTLIDEYPTYAALDRMRKDIGRAIGKGKGPFADEEMGILKSMYGALSDDQIKAAGVHGAAREYEIGLSLSKKSHEVQDAAVALFGRHVEGSVLPALRASARGLTQGDLAKMKKLFGAIPEHRRQEAAATMLNELFNFGARSGKGVGEGFRNAYEGLNRSPLAKDLLFRYLPPEAKKRFDNIGKVAKGIWYAKQYENKSRSGSVIMNALKDPQWLSKVYDTGRKVVGAEAITSTLGASGLGAAAVLGGIFSKTRTPLTKAADEMMASPAFLTAVEKAARGDVVDAQDILAKSKQFKAWSKQQPPGVKKNIAALGFFAWLTNPETPEEAGQLSP